MANIATQFEGRYTLTNKKLEGKSLTLLKGHRIKANQSALKSPIFLLQVLPNGKRKYISSLWPGSSDNTYSFEYGGIRYHYIEESTNQVTIQAHV